MSTKHYVTQFYTNVLIFMIGTPHNSKFGKLLCSTLCLKYDQLINFHPLSKVNIENDGAFLKSHFRLLMSIWNTF